jgi:eukaryotic-like serine/threonine-protein kinase
MQKVGPPAYAPSEMTMMTGVLLGKYLLEAPLGAGGMAEVFRAHTQGVEGFRRPVAIKRILPAASRNPAFAEMFVAEAKLSSRLQHPNIVSVLDFDRDPEGCLYLVMELVDGRDLDEVIGASATRLPPSLVVYVVTEVLRGLGYAHDLPAGPDGVRGLIHRDISPHNVLCAWNGAVKVSDFGIAKARAATAASASIVIKGKPAYMSPEQINGAPLDGRSDLFAVGVMLWQMLTGQHLFALGTTTETLARVLYAPVPAPRSLVPEVPADLEAVTLRLLARDRTQRYATAEDAIDDLLRCADAPRDGRRELERLMIERFPNKAPVRARRASSAGSPQVRGTVPLPPATDATRTMQPKPAARASPAGRARLGLAGGGRIAVALVVAALLVGAAIAAVLAVTTGSHPTRAEAAAEPGAPSVDAAADATADATADANDGPPPPPPIDAREALPQADAGPPPAVAPPSRRRPRTTPPRAEGGIHEIRIPPPEAPR